MQIDVVSLQTLAEEYNSTVWTAIPSTAGPDAEPRDYFLDVNPYWVERVHGDGANFIDARFIDTRNGLYVDITALTELDPENRPNIVSCKNYHNYRLEDIYPLRESVFEGTKAKVPYNYKTILAEEYSQRSLVLAVWEGYYPVLDIINIRYVWVKSMSEWIPRRNAKKPFSMHSLPSTPPTRVISDNELPYYESAPEIANTHTSSIPIEELPPDRIDAPQLSSKGGIFTTFWEYLTLFWRN
jgi:LicD family